MTKAVGIAIALAAVSLGFGTALTDGAETGLVAMAKPQYTDEGLLIRPTDFREWIFVGSSLGLSYFGDEPPDRAPVFHHVYMQPEAYRHYVETGKFPEKTMLVMENYSAGTKENNSAGEVVKDKAEFVNLHGQFEDRRVGLEVALKDSENFEDRWAYFNFSRSKDLVNEAKAFPKAVCWNCHNDHAADDNVFVQFYPVLREHLEKRK